MEGNDLADLRIRENLLVEDRSKKVEVSFAVEEIDERTSRLHVDVIGVVENHEFSDNHSVFIFSEFNYRANHEIISIYKKRKSI